MKLFAPIHSCFLVSSFAPPESFIACGELAVELAENMDTAAEVAGVGGCIQGLPGQSFDLQEFALVCLWAVHGDDYWAAIVAGALGVDVCAAEGGADDGRLFGVGESRQRRVLSPALPALRSIIEERLDGGVGFALHVAVDVPEIDNGRKGHPKDPGGKLLDRDGVLAVCAAHERDLADLRALGSELDYCRSRGSHGTNHQSSLCF